MNEKAEHDASLFARANVDEALKNFLQRPESYAPLVQGWLAAIDQELRAAAKKAMPYLSALASIDWVEVTRRLDELPQKSKAAMILASSRGWFFGWHTGLQNLIELIEKLGVTQTDDIDNVMAEYYRPNIKLFTEELALKYPARAAAINAATNAHLFGTCAGYLLCIPVFIAQADGLLTEITEVKSAMMRDNKTRELQASKALREKLANDQESLDLLYQILMLHESDFMKSAEPRQLAEQASGKPFAALNRHQIMHGELSDYGTEINSLKAFSFLVVVGAHLPAILVVKI